MESWFSCNKLSVNIDKTCYTLFNYKKDVLTDNLNILLLGTPIVRVKDCKYLGIIIDERLKWDTHIDAIYNNLIKFTSIFAKLRVILPAGVLKKLYFALVHSRLLSGIEVYGNAEMSVLDKLIKLNNKILRIIQWQKMDCPLFELYNRYNTLPIPALFQYQLLKLMFTHNHCNSLLPPALQNYFESNNAIHSHDTRSKNDFHLSSVSKKYGTKTIAFAGGKLWNNLPDSLKKLPSLNLFLKEMKKYLRNKFFDK